jgi:uncharacterized protein
MNHPIQFEKNGAKGAFFIENDGQRLAEMTLSFAGDQLVIIDHTEVDDSLRGTGAGQALVKAAVAWARENGKKFIPLCPFAKSVFDKSAELRDVLK